MGDASRAMKEAVLWERLDDARVRCDLCAHRCTIAEGHVGVCQVRENTDGVLYTLVYGRAVARRVDPIEKKPLYHFHPGSASYSIAAPGCNFRCRWCQNSDISQAPAERRFAPDEYVAPEQIVESALEAGCRSIAYTYTEPTIFFEYTYDAARRAKDAGLGNVYVTNGYMTAGMLDLMHPYLDAANVDLKGFRDDVYRRYAGARLEPVLQSMKTMKRLGIWLEVTTLIVPGVNDSREELRDASRFIANELGPETPWHISRFTPAYKMIDAPPTPVATLLEAREIGREAGLHHVYLGNLFQAADTVCGACGHLLIRRLGHRVLANAVGAGGRCPECGTIVAGRGMGGAD